MQNHSEHDDDYDSEDSNSYNYAPGEQIFKIEKLHSEHCSCCKKQGRNFVSGAGQLRDNYSACDQLSSVSDEILHHGDSPDPHEKQSKHSFQSAFKENSTALKIDEIV